MVDTKKTRSTLELRSTVVRPMHVLLLIVATGCPSPNTYTTARTLSPGRYQVVAAPEGYGGLATDPDTATKVDGFVTLPTVGARVGVSDNIDLGARLPNLSSVAADVKIALRRGTVDLALDPGLQWYEWSATEEQPDSTPRTNYSGHVFYLQLPLLVDYNLSRTVTLVASPGATLVGNYSKDADAKAELSALGQLGLGVDLRVASWLSIFPQITFISGFSSETDLMFMGGIGFNFGHQPSFDDLDGASSEALQRTARR